MARVAALSALLLAACVGDISGTQDGTEDGEGGGGGGEGGGPDAAPTGGDEVAADCPRAEIHVMAGNTLNVRSAPDTASDVVGQLPNNAVVAVLERVQGEAVEGNDEWLQIESGVTVGFVSGAYAECTTKEAPVLEPPAAYHLPLECGSSSSIAQGNDGGFTHQGRAYYAYDFSIPVNTPLVAMADGIVLYTFDETGPGDPCYDGGGSDCFPYANYVVLLHGDGSGSIYKHLNRVDVAVGEHVPSGVTVGLSGSTGYSTGPHAHVMRQEECGAATSCQSIPLTFADVAGDGVPDKGDTVTSENCPPP